MLLPFPPSAPICLEGRIGWFHVDLFLFSPYRNVILIVLYWFCLISTKSGHLQVPSTYITCISVPSQTRYSRTPAGWRSRRRWRWSLWSWSSRTWSWSSRMVWLRSGRGRWRWLLGSARCPATWIRKWRWEQWRSWRVGADLGNLVGDSEELWDPRLVGQAAEGGAWADRGNGNVGDHHVFHVNMYVDDADDYGVGGERYLQKTAEWVCSCWTVRSRAGETQKLFLTQALDAARGSERINCSKWKFDDWDLCDDDGLTPCSRSEVGCREEKGILVYDSAAVDGQ